VSIRRGLCLVLLLVPACGPKREEPSFEVRDPIVVSGVGFATPESVLHDAEQDVYFVSNINGSPLDADDNGFISVVSAAGDTLALKWIDGASPSVVLNAPKGMAVAGPYLFVADITALRRFDRRSGQALGEIPVPGATFLNDVVAAEDGTIYFTDSGLKAGAGGLEPSGTDAVYRINPDGVMDTLAMGRDLGNPNGVAASGDSVWVVSGSGEMYRIVNGKKAGTRKLPNGSLDGLVVFGGEAFMSSWDAKGIYRGKIDGPSRLMLGNLEAPADIGHDLWRNRLLIPLFNANELRIVPLAETRRTPPPGKPDSAKP